MQWNGVGLILMIPLSASDVVEPATGGHLDIVYYDPFVMVMIALSLLMSRMRSMISSLHVEWSQSLLSSFCPNFGTVSPSSSSAHMIHCLIQLLKAQSGYKTISHGNPSQQLRPKLTHGIRHQDGAEQTCPQEIRSV